MNERAIIKDEKKRKRAQMTPEQHELNHIKRAQKKYMKYEEKRKKKEKDEVAGLSTSVTPARG